MRAGRRRGGRVPLVLFAGLVCALGGVPAPVQARISRGAGGDVAVQYEVDATDLTGRTVSVTARIRRAPEPLEVFIPAWSPGAYRLIHYERFLQPVDASGAHGRELAWMRQDDGVWRIDGARAGEEVVLRYRVACERLTEEGCALGASWGLLNGPPLFLGVTALRGAAVTVRFVVPKRWRIASALDGGPDLFRAPDYDTLVDGPTLVGAFAEGRATAEGTPLRVVVAGGTGPAAQRLAVAGARIAVAQRALMGAFPFHRYLFLLVPIAEPRILGLEHASSSVILLPTAQLAAAVPADETQWVLSHELFHAWNAKRLRPRDLAMYDYRHAQPSRLLWFSEGVTEYYAHRALRRAGVYDAARYLAVLGAELGRAASAPPRRTSLEDDSAGIWDRPDASTEADTAYYVRGHVVAALLDMELRGRTGGVRSLDGVLRGLLAGPAAGPEAPRLFDRLGLRQALDQAGGSGMAGLFDRWTVGTGFPAPADTLARMGLRYDLRPAEVRADAGFETERRDGQLRVATVRPGGPADTARIAVGDQLLAIAGVTADETWEARVLAAPPGTRVAVSVARPGGVVERTVVLGELREMNAFLAPSPGPADGLRAAWLGIEAAR